MKWCYNKIVIFFFTLLFNHAKLNSLPQIQRMPSSQSLDYRKYVYTPNVNTGNNLVVNKFTLEEDLVRPLSVGWSRLVTTVENYRGKVLEQSIDYQLSLQSSFDLFNNEDSSSIDFYKARNQIVKEKDFTFCDPGPCYSHKIFTLTINQKRNTFDIKPSLDSLTQIMVAFAPVNPEVQTVINMILNANLPEDQYSLAKTIIALIQKHLAIEIENVELSESIEVYDKDILVKYVDSNGEYCYRKLGANLQSVPCPMDTSSIPLYNLDSDNAVPVKYIDSNGMEHCFDMSIYNVRPIICPLDTSLLPEIDVKKYLDDDNREHCSALNGVSTVHFACPQSLSSLPLSPIENFKNALVKYVDPQGRLHCYYRNNAAFSETECPQDFSNLPTFNPYKNFVKYVDAQGRASCFYKSDAVLEPIACPADLSQIRDISLNDEAMPIKYIGPDGRIHCFSYRNSGLNERKCPADTSLYPDINIKKYMDENRLEICYLSVEQGHKRIDCPHGLHLLLTPLDDLDDIIVKDTDAQGIVRCYWKTGQNFKPVTCPRDTSLLPEVNPFKQNKLNLDLVPEFRPSSGRDSVMLRPSYGNNMGIGVPSLPLNKIYGQPGRGSDQDLVKYVDGNGEYCFRKVGTILQSVPCPMDTSSIPLYNLDSDNAVPVKYVDSNGMEHCFDMSIYNVRPIMCPLDTSLLPEIDVKKYLDDNNREYCSALNGVSTVHFACPQSLSSLPLSPIENFKNALVKYVDSQGRLHCYYRNNVAFSETECPQDFSNLPTFNPYKNFVKYVDAQGRANCFYKIDAVLEPIACPADLSQIRDISLNDEAIPIKYIGPDGRIHCFSYRNSGLNERNCPADTSLYPLINIKKYIDENGLEICYLSVEQGHKRIDCPQGLHLPLTSLDDLDDIIVKDTDAQGRVRCYWKTGNNFNSVPCPRDTSLLPEVNPFKQNKPDLDLVPEFRPSYGRDSVMLRPSYGNNMGLNKIYGQPGRRSDQDLVKYVDANGEHCFRKVGTILQSVPCPMDTSSIPLYNLDSDNAMPVKYVDSNGMEHCFDMSIYNVRPIICPLDTSLLPEIDVKKYLDDNNREYCSALNGVSTVHFACPQSLSSLPLSPMENFKNALVKYVDSQGRLHCYYRNNVAFSETECPQDFSNLPTFNPYKNFVKYVDAQGRASCFYKSDAVLEPIACPADLSQIRDISLNDEAMPIKYIGPDGRIHCFSYRNSGLNERNCPADTSLYPLINIKKYIDENGLEICYLSVEQGHKRIDCPQGLNLPLTSLDDLDNIIIKNTDAQGRVRCYRKTASNFNPITCPRDTSRLPEVNPFKKLDVDLVPEFRPSPGVFRPSYGLNMGMPSSMYGRSPLMDILSGLNIGGGLGNFSPDGSGKINLSYNDLMTLSKLICKKNPY